MAPSRISMDLSSTGAPHLHELLGGDVAGQIDLLHDGRSGAPSSASRKPGQRQDKADDQ